MSKEHSMQLLALVTLFNPDREKAIINMSLYKHCVQMLIVWDNSSKCHDSWFSNDTTILYHWTGENVYIAPAINFALKYAKQNHYDGILVMDQDSQWVNFHEYYDQICDDYSRDKNKVFTPYIIGNDTFPITQPMMNRRIFINSGTVIPTHILDHIGGADEIFPLDALDNDLSYRVLQAGYSIVCLTSCKLNHTIGRPEKSSRCHFFTNNYGRFRTYSITKSHIICYRKHHDFMTRHEISVFYKEYFFWKLIRIMLVEEDKLGRFIEFCKGIRDGLKYDIINK